METKVTFLTCKEDLGLFHGVKSPTSRIVLTGTFLVMIVLIVPRTITRAQVALTAFANFEGSQTNPIRLSSDGTRLFAVNTPDSTLSVFDVTQPSSPLLLAQIPVGLEPVSVNPRTDDEAWVVNQVSNSISVVSVSRKIVTDTIAARTEPMDVVFAGGLAYVSKSRSNQIAAYDVNTHAQTAVIQLYADNPRALAVSPDGSKVYAAIAFSGNGTTVVPPSVAPPQSAPSNPALPPPPQVALIVKASDPNWTHALQFAMPDNDIAIINTGTTPTLAGYYSGVGTTNLGLAVNPTTGDIFVANTDALNLTHFEPNLRGHFVNNRITRITAATGQVTPFDLNPGMNYSVLPNPPALATALAQPTSVVFDPGGAFMWVAAFGTDRVAQVDTNGNVLSRIEIAQASGAGSNVDPINKKGPRGLALNAVSQTLYVLNRLSNSISIVNTSQKTVLSEISIGDNPTPTVIRNGRGFLYDAKLSGNGTGSCASCHVDGDMDHIAWDLGDPGGSMASVTQGSQTFQFHPMKGPMTTQTFRGISNLAPYHWRGDRANFAAFNAAFSTLLGGPQLSDANMANYTNFVNTLLFLPNPYENLDRSLPNSLLNGNAVTGQTDFSTLKLSVNGTALVTCASCHTSTSCASGTNLQIIQPAGTPQPLKVPQLRNVYQKVLKAPYVTSTGLQVIDGFGLTHDGSTTLPGFFAAKSFTLYSPQQVLDISAFLFSFDTGTAPAVGYTRTITSANYNTSSVQSDWTTLQSQAAAGSIDLIARGTLGGILHGLKYVTSLNIYVSNTLGNYTQAQLQTLIQKGDTLTFMGAYPGTGQATQY